MGTYKYAADYTPYEFSVNDTGICYGNETVTKVIIPKEIFIEAYEHYIVKGEQK